MSVYKFYKVKKSLQDNLIKIKYYEDHKNTKLNFLFN